MRRCSSILLVLAIPILLMGSATRARAILPLLEDDPQDLTNFHISVRVQGDGIDVWPIGEFVWLADGGTGSLEFTRCAGVEPKYALKEFGFEYVAGNYYESVVTVDGYDIPISLTLDEARFRLRNADGSAASDCVLVASTLAGIHADQMEANVRGRVTIFGIVFPFDFYDPIWDCPPISGVSGCIYVGSVVSGVPGSGVWFLDALGSTEVTGTKPRDYSFPRSGYPMRILEPLNENYDIIGELGGLKVSVVVNPIWIERVTYTIPEPSGLAAVGSGISLLVFLYRRRRYSVNR